MDQAKYIRKGVVTSYINTIGSALISFGSIPIIIHNLGLEIYGEWTLIFIFIGLSGFADMGISKTLVLLSNESKEEDFGKFVSAAIILSSALFLILFVFSLVFFLSTQEKVSLLDREETWTLIFCGAGILFLIILSSLLASCLEAKMKVHWVNIGLFIMTSGNYLAVLTVTQFTSQVTHLFITTFAVYLVVFLYHLFLYSKFVAVRLRWPERSIYKEFWNHSKGFTYLSLINSLVPSINRSLVVYLSGSASVYGLFDTLLKLVFTANSLLFSVSSPLYSLMSKFKQSISRLQLVKRFTLSVFGLSVIGVLLYALLGEEIWKYFLGEEYVEGVYLAGLLAISFFCATGVTEPITRYLWSESKAILTAKIRMVVLPMNLLLLLSYNPESIFTWYAISFSFPYFVVGVITLIYFLRLQSSTEPI